MPYTNIWKNNGLGLHRKFTGEVSGEEILESNLELHINPKFHEVDYIINDFSAVSKFIIDIALINIIAETDNIISKTVGKLKIALVIPLDETLMLELAGHYKQMIKQNNFTCEIFHELNPAQDWVK